MPLFVWRQLFTLKLLHSLVSATQFQVFREVASLEEILVEKLEIGLLLAFYVQPLPQVLLIRVVLVRHVAGVASVGHMADGIHTIERDCRRGRVLANLVVRMIPDEDASATGRKPRYLDAEVLSVPSLAAERIRLETARIGDRIVEGVRSMHTERDEPVDPTGFLAAADDAEALYASVVEYARKVRTDDAGRRTDAVLGRLLLSANHLMSITDTVPATLLLTNA